MVLGSPEYPHPPRANQTRNDNDASAHREGAINGTPALLTSVVLELLNHKDALLLVQRGEVDD